MAAKGSCQAKAYLLEIQVSKSARNLLGVEALAQVPRSLLLFSLEERAQRPSLWPEDRLLLCLSLGGVLSNWLITRHLSLSFGGSLVFRGIFSLFLDNDFGSGDTQVFIILNINIHFFILLIILVLHPVSLIVHYFLVLLLALIHVDGHLQFINILLQIRLLICLLLLFLFSVLSGLLSI